MLRLHPPQLQSGSLSVIIYYITSSCYAHILKHHGFYLLYRILVSYFDILHVELLLYYVTYRRSSQ